MLRDALDAAVHLAGAAVLRAHSRTRRVREAASLAMELLPHTSLSPAPLLYAPMSSATHAIYLSPTDASQFLLALNDGSIVVHPSKQLVLQRRDRKVLRLRAHDETCLALWDDGILSLGSNVLYQLDADSALDFAVVMDAMLRRLVVFVGGAKPTLGRFVLPEPAQPTSFLSSLISYVAPASEVVDVYSAVSLDDEDRCVSRLEACQRLVVSLDNFGRLLVTHAATLTVLHVLRGYRACAFGFLYSVESQALLVVERRRVVEVWDRARLMGSFAAPASALLVCDDEGHAALVDAVDLKCTPLAPPSTAELECVRLARAFCSTGTGREPTVIPDDLKRLPNAALQTFLGEIAHVDLNGAHALSLQFHRQLVLALQPAIKQDGKTAALLAEISARTKALDALVGLGQLPQLALAVASDAPPLAAAVARRLGGGHEPTAPQRNVSEWIRCFTSNGEASLTSSAADALFGPLLRGDVLAAKHVLRVEEAMGGAHVHDAALASWFVARPVERFIAEPLASRAVVVRLLKADAAVLLATARAVACGSLGLARAWLLAECVGDRAEAEAFRVAAAVAAQLGANDLHVDAVPALLPERVAATALHHGLDCIRADAPAGASEADADVFAVDATDVGKRIQTVLRLVPAVDGVDVRDRLALGWAEKQAWAQVVTGLKHGASARPIWPLAVAAQSLGCIAECLALGPDKRRAVAGRLLMPSPSTASEANSSNHAHAAALMAYVVSAPCDEVAPEPASLGDALLERLAQLPLSEALELGRELGVAEEPVCCAAAVCAYEQGKDEAGIEALARVPASGAPAWLGEQLLSVAARRVAVVLERARHDKNLAPVLALVSAKTTSWVLATPGARPTSAISLPQTHALVVKGQALAGNAAAAARFAELRALVEAL